MPEELERMILECSESLEKDCFLSESYKNILKLALEYFMLEDELPSSTSYYNWNDKMDEAILEASKSLE